MADSLTAVADMRHHSDVVLVLRAWLCGVELFGLSNTSMLPLSLSFAVQCL